MFLSDLAKKKALELEQYKGQPSSSTASAASKITNETPVALLNLISAQNECTPTYNLIAREGRVHAPVFTYQVEMCGMVEEGSGASKKKAKHIAARNLLRRLVNDTEMVDPEMTTPIREVLKRCDEEDIAEGLALNKQLQEKAAAAAAVAAAEAAEGGEVVPSSSKPTSAQSDPDEVNPIGKLQEICMKKYWHPPVYEDVGERGLPHERQFEVVCIIENMDLRQNGVGKSKKIAKRNAAQDMLNKLRHENMDKVDELLDRLPRPSASASKSDSFDLISEITHMKKNTEPKVSQDKLRASFFLELANDQAKMDKLRALFACDFEQFVIDFMSDLKVLPEADKVSARIEQIIACKVDMSPYSEKRADGKFQCLAEFIAQEPKYDSVSILCTYGCDEDLEVAKQKTLTKCILVLLCNLVPAA